MSIVCLKIVYIVRDTGARSLTLYAGHVLHCVLFIDRVIATVACHRYWIEEKYQQQQQKHQPSAEILYSNRMSLALHHYLQAALMKLLMFCAYHWASEKPYNLAEAYEKNVKHLTNMSPRSLSSPRAYLDINETIVCSRFAKLYADQITEIWERELMIVNCIVWCMEQIFGMVQSNFSNKIIRCFMVNPFWQLQMCLFKTVLLFGSHVFVQVQKC